MPLPSAPPGDPDRLVLNVGGEYFVTTREALFRGQPRQMLGCLYSQDVDGGLCLKEKDRYGAYMLDRCPTYAAPILDYLQHGRLLLNDKISHLGVIEEAKFFGLDSLIPDIERMMKDQNLSGADLSWLELQHVVFKGADLSMCNFEGADLSHSDFEATQLYGAKMIKANLEGADFRCCKMGDPNGPVEKNANLQWANLKDANMDGSVLYGVNFRNATLTNASLQDCDLRYAAMGYADVMVRASLS
ncbi:BTB/POZ domain-containing protein KCTD9-like [Dermacentor silvarum]|uniref:BTB/POZ domain-containing protein KCTD9-like n=1 Tax=Dermacentor silvarum TaxID=543639 RepID=UPI002100C766|nr:BTB/POZ domain-containing protein KCTD9-like [Dermacentor silvarum]